MKHLAIIGLDPGTTSAYAILNLKGELIKTNSGKEFSLSEMIKEIMDECTPLIVSTDKAKIPGFVEEFSRQGKGYLHHART